MYLPIRWDCVRRTLLRFLQRRLKAASETHSLSTIVSSLRNVRGYRYRSTRPSEMTNPCRMSANQSTLSLLASIPIPLRVGTRDNLTAGAAPNESATHFGPSCGAVPTCIYVASEMCDFSFMTPHCRIRATGGAGGVGGGLIRSKYIWGPLKSKNLSSCSCIALVFYLV